MLKKDRADIEAERVLKIEMDNAKRQRSTDIALIAVLCVFILFFGIFIFIKPQKSFSEDENRSLVTFPEFSAESLLNGSFTSGVGKFYSDQFPFRDTLVGVKAFSELAMLKEENNGVILGSDGYLIKRIEYNAADEENLAQNLEYIREFTEKLDALGINYNVAIAPRTIDVMAEKLPDNYSTDRAESIWRIVDESGIEVIRFDDELTAQAKRDEYVWFKTDHHWTVRGAYTAYCKLMSSSDLAPLPLNAFSFEEVSNKFYGTTYSSSGMKWAIPDSLELMRYNGDTDLTVTNVESGAVLNGLYDYSYIDTKDKYSIFIGGVNAHVSVSKTAPSGEQKPRLLLIKDSFAHSAVPFLAAHYDLEIIDLRYYRASVARYIEENKFDAVLILYGIDTLTTDSNVRWLTFGLDN